MIQLVHPTKNLKGEVNLPSSKSLTNRLFILQAHHPQLKITNPSTSDDSKFLKKGINQNNQKIEVGHGGTTARFLLAFHALNKNSNVVISGSTRLHKRPIKPLILALRSLGAQITCLEEEDSFPVKVIGKKPNKKEVEIAVSESSQFLTALALNAARFEKGLTIYFNKSKLVSTPYVSMTFSLLKKLNYEVKDVEGGIFIKASRAMDKTIEVEKDWSAASYFFGMAALAEEAELTLLGLKPNALQGDAKITGFFHELGISTKFSKLGMHLIKRKRPLLKQVILNCQAIPDLAQTIAVALSGLKIPFELTGLQTLKHKETDRLKALQNELQKINVGTQITSKAIVANPKTQISGQTFKTYQDHRMAMSFSMLALLGKINIENESVVSKSFPLYWEELKKIGFVIDITSSI